MLIPGLTAFQSLAASLRFDDSTTTLRESLFLLQQQNHSMLCDVLSTRFCNVLRKRDFCLDVKYLHSNTLQANFRGKYF